jgi:glutathione S-transferase
MVVSLIMYERVGHEDRRPSPFSWRIRYALAHKGVPAEFHLVRFADVETIRALSGQHMVPILRDGQWRRRQHARQRLWQGLHGRLVENRHEGAR